MATRADTTRAGTGDAPGGLRPVRWGPVLLCGWGLIAVLDASQAYLVRTAEGFEPTWGSSFGWALPTWALWAGLTPVVFWLARRYRIEPSGWERAVVIHLFCGVGLAVLHYAGYVVVGRVLGWPVASQELVPALFSGRFHINLLVYSAILGLYHAFDYYRRFRERELQAANLSARASVLEAQLAQAQLQALKMQLHPHFLFNTLNAISVLVRGREEQAAVRMLTRLSEFLRLALENAGQQEVPLGEELAFLEHYLEIERIRFQDRLRVEMAVDPDALGALVPNMITQPLVENAIRHGIARRAEAGLVEIRAERKGALLYLQIRDDGRGLPPGGLAAGSRGIGLTNTRARLQQRYGAQHRFEIENAPEGGAVVRLAIPYRAAPKKAAPMIERKKEPFGATPGPDADVSAVSEVLRSPSVS